MTRPLDDSFWKLDKAFICVADLKYIRDILKVSAILNTEALLLNSLCSAELYFSAGRSEAQIKKNIFQRLS